MVATNSKTSKDKDTSKTPLSADLEKLVEEIKDSNNILITVSRNPSVDALSAALGITAIVDKMGKHGTAIFSGKVPPAIKFLNPDKIFEDTADSLRDFIIALSKEKADHLRYKVDGDVVKIYVTPYKTVISEKDLEFSQGDYNVELVIALGVGDQKDLDAALAAHGRILHDATVTTINVGEEKSELGTINLHSANASSLSELVADISEQLNKGSSEKLIDEQIATALMTGIVATTDRFSNDRTTSRTMAVAAVLLGAGADQQLISSQLEEAKEEPAEEPESAEPTPEEPTSSKRSADGSLSISHDDEESASRLVISTLSPDQTDDPDSEKEDDTPEPVRIPTATEILSQLAASQDEIENDNQSFGGQNDVNQDHQSKIDTDDGLAEALAQTVSPSIQSNSSETSNETSSEMGTRSYLEMAEEVTTNKTDDDDALAVNRLSSEQSPSIGAEPLRGNSSVTTVVEPLNEINPMDPPIVDPVPTPDNLPQFNVDQSAEAILQAALNTATPAAELDRPVLPPPPPPALPDFSTLPPALPDFSTLPSPAPDVSLAPTPIVSTLPPEDMILAGQNQQASSSPSDPTQFRIPGQ